MEPRNLVLLALVATSALSDLYAGKVYDSVTWPAVALGLVLNAYLPAGDGVRASVMGFGLGFGVLYLLFLTGRMGGGDVKLMGAVGALKGPAFAYAVLVYGFLLGALISVLYSIWGRGPDDAPAPAIPFGAAICFAALWAMAEELSGRTLVEWIV